MIFKKLIRLQYKTFIHKGFTLAEVMTVIAILGVLAAVLIPTVMNTAPDNNKIMFKKAYHSLEQAISIMINDDINYPSEQTFPLAGGSVPRGFNYTEITTNTVGVVNYNKFCYFLYDQLNTISGGVTACPSNTGIADTQAAVATTKVTTSDGMDWYVYIPASDASSIGQDADSAITTAVQFPLISTFSTTRVIVDVNGDAKEPNCTEDTSATTYLPSSYEACAENEEPDTFIINVRYDGKLRVGCSSDDLCTTATDPTAVSILSAPTDNQ